MSEVQERKARKLINKNRICQIDKNEFLILPIEKYNKTSYEVTRNRNHYFCTCQFSTNIGLECSHIKAVKIMESENI